MDIRWCAPSHLPEGAGLLQGALWGLLGCQDAAKFKPWPEPTGFCSVGCLGEGNQQDLSCECGLGEDCHHERVGQDVCHINREELRCCTTPCRGCYSSEWGTHWIEIVHCYELAQFHLQKKFHLMSHSSSVDQFRVFWQVFHILPPTHVHL